MASTVCLIKPRQVEISSLSHTVFCDSCVTSSYSWRIYIVLKCGMKPTVTFENNTSFNVASGRG